MKTDRELLELAAKAAGIKARWFKVNKYKTKILRTGPASMHSGTIDVFGTHHTKPWNPLDDDGDSLRLAVMLRLEIEHNHASETEELWVCASIGEIAEMEDFRSKASRLAATRRAIVRAAAAIGEAMQ